LNNPLCKTTVIALIQEMKMSNLESKNHAIVRDYTGAFESILRYTCYNNECECASITWQPWMNRERWRREVDEFQQNHSPALIMDWVQYKNEQNNDAKNL